MAESIEYRGYRIKQSADTFPRSRAGLSQVANPFKRIWISDASGILVKTMDNGTIEGAKEWLDSIYTVQRIPSDTSAIQIVMSSQTAKGDGYLRCNGSDANAIAGHDKFMEDHIYEFFTNTCRDLTTGEWIWGGPSNASVAE